MGGGKKLPNAKKALKRTTNKAERQALKDQKKSGNLKTKAERLAEITSLKEQIGKWQITPDFEPVAQLFEAMDTFVETGEAARGVIPFLECPPQPQGRNIVYVFPSVRGNRATSDFVVRDGSTCFNTASRSKLPILDPASFQGTNPDFRMPLPGQDDVPVATTSDTAPVESGPLPDLPETVDSAGEAEARAWAMSQVPSVEAIQAEMDRLCPQQQDGIQVHAVSHNVVRIPQGDSFPPSVEIVE